MASLDVHLDGGRIALHHTERDPIQIGRSEFSTVPLDDDLVSRLHCLIRQVGPGRFEVVDQSTHGTFVNGQRVGRRQPHPLRDGDVLTVGPYRITFRVTLRRRRMPVTAPVNVYDDGPSISFGELVGRSRAMHDLVDTIKAMAPHPWNVLVRGETGTGKELVARALHDHGAHPHGPFVVLNAAGLSEHLVESELFGHVKGAFTGADCRRDGAFHDAHGGTLFLDEIGDLLPSIQARLLRVLESGEVRRVGSTRVERPEVRVVAATHQDLERMCSMGLFRPDLLERLQALTLRLPPLRDRREDIPDLVQALLARHHPGTTITTRAVRALQRHDWPGNVRGLRNVLLGSVIRSGGPIRIHDLDLVGIPTRNDEHAVDTDDGDDDGDDDRDESEAAWVLELYETVGSARKIEKLTGIDRRRVGRILRAHGIDLSR